MGTDGSGNNYWALWPGSHTITGDMTHNPGGLVPWLASGSVTNEPPEALDHEND